MLKNKIKKKLIQWLHDIQSEDIDIKNNPFDICFDGKNSKIKMPARIGGGKYITIKERSTIGANSWLQAYDRYEQSIFTPKICIGKNVHIGNFACITAIDSVDIGDNSLISEHVYISDHGHEFDPEMEGPIVHQPLYSKGKVVIGKNCFIGYRVSILSGVTLGDHCVVGAHSLVNQSFPAYSMIAGIPARVIKKYSVEEKKWIKI